MKQLKTLVALSLLFSGPSAFVQAKTTQEKEIKSETGEVVGTEYGLSIDRPEANDITTAEGKVAADTFSKKYWVIQNMTGGVVDLASDSYQIPLLQNNEAVRLYRTKSFEFRVSGNTFETKNHCIVLYKGEGNKGMLMDSWALEDNRGFAASPHGSKTTVFPAEMQQPGPQGPGFGPGPQGPGFGPGPRGGGHGHHGPHHGGPHHGGPR